MANIINLPIPVSAPYGGTGLSSYTVGDLLYANTTSSLARLSDVTAGQILTSNGVGVAPVYSSTLSNTVLASVTQVTVSVLTTGTGSTYTTPANCTHLWVRAWGAGGGGGGISGVSSTTAGSGGGGSGAYVEKIISNPASSYLFTIGVGGTGGAAGGANTGNTGGTTTFGSLSAGGGGGGQGATGTLSVGFTSGGSGGSASGGDINLIGSYGSVGIILSGASAAGQGAAAPSGGGATRQRLNNTDGVAGNLPGGGGGGGESAGSSINGGSGANGLIVIQEFYVG